MGSSFKNLKEHLHRKSLRDPLKVVISPDREWRSIFLIFWISFLCIALWSAYIYYSFVVVAGQENAKVSPGKVISKESFAPVFDALDIRARKFEDLRAAFPASSDPGKR